MAEFHQTASFNSLKHQFDSNLSQEKKIYRITSNKVLSKLEKMNSYKPPTKQRSRSGILRQRLTHKSIEFPNQVNSLTQSRTIKNKDITQWNYLSITQVSPQSSFRQQDQSVTPKMINYNLPRAIPPITRLIQQDSVKSGGFYFSQPSKQFFETTFQKTEPTQRIDESVKENQKGMFGDRTIFRSINLNKNLYQSDKSEINLPYIKTKTFLQRKPQLTIIDRIFGHKN